MSALALPGEQQQPRLESRAAILDVVNAHTTAASNTQTSVEKNMSNDNDEEAEG